MNLAEKYRPTTWAEVVGQDVAVGRIKRLAARGLAGRAYWITGASGVGKTTIAWILAREVADDIAIEELTASELTPARLAELERTWCLYGLGRGGRAYIVNEAHGLRRDGIRVLKDVLERLPRHVAVVFTTTRGELAGLFDDDQEDAGPFVDRCVPVPLTNQGLSAAFAARAKEIAETEHLDGRDIGEYVKLARKCGNSMRAMLQAIESGAMVE